jgi:hypothetical protein
MRTVHPRLTHTFSEQSDPPGGQPVHSPPLRAGFKSETETGLLYQRHQFLETFVSDLYFVKIDTCCILMCIKYN